MLLRKAVSYLWRVGAALIVFVAICGAALLCFVDTPAYAQQPTADDFIAEADYCHFTGRIGARRGQSAAGVYAGSAPASASIFALGSRNKFTRV